jgi:hypothetical protein
VQRLVNIFVCGNLEGGGVSSRARALEAQVPLQLLVSAGAFWKAIRVGYRQTYSHVGDHPARVLPIIALLSWPRLGPSAAGWPRV